MGGGPAEARAGQTFGRYPLGREIVKENPLRPREGAVAERGKAARRLDAQAAVRQFLGV